MKINILAVLSTTGLKVVEPEATSIAHPYGEPVTLSVHVQRDDGMHCNPANRTYTLRISPPVVGAGPVYKTSVTPTEASTDWRQDIPVNLPNGIPAGTYRWDLSVTDEGTAHMATLEASWQILSSTRT